MNTATIEKSIELLNSLKLDELRELLTFERQKSIFAERGKKTTFLTAVKKIIADKHLKETRPNLAAIQHTQDGKPFICDGFVLIAWKDDRTELNAFNQTEASRSVNADNILDRFEGDCHPLSAEDNTVINNLDKFIKLYSKKGNPFCPVVFCEITFDAHLLKKVIDIIGADKITEVRIHRIGASVKIETDEATALVMSLRDTQYKAEAEANTKKFAEQIKNN